MAYGMTNEKLLQLQNECRERYTFRPQITEIVQENPTEKLKEVEFFEAEIKPHRQPPIRRPKFNKFERKNIHEVIPDKPHQIIRAKAEYNNIETPFGIASELLKEQSKRTV